MVLLNLGGAMEILLKLNNTYVAPPKSWSSWAGIRCLLSGAMQVELSLKHVDPPGFSRSKSDNYRDLTLVAPAAGKDLPLLRATIFNCINKIKS